METRMRTYVCLFILLGLVTSLSVYFSFWVVFGFMFSGGMLLVVLIAFTVKSKESRTSRFKVLNDGKGQLIKGQTASEDIKAAWEISSLDVLQHTKLWLLGSTPGGHFLYVRGSGNHLKHYTSYLKNNARGIIVNISFSLLNAISPKNLFSKYHWM